MARARISLPVPLSPVMRTLTLVRATLRRTPSARACFPEIIARPSSGSSSIGHSVARSSRSARAFCTSCKRREEESQSR